MGRGQQLQELGVVVEHLLEVRHEPVGIDRVAGEAAAEMVVDAALADARERVQHAVAQGPVAAAPRFLPDQAQDRAPAGTWGRRARPPWIVSNRSASWRATC